MDNVSALEGRKPNSEDKVEFSNISSVVWKVELKTLITWKKFHRWITNWPGLTYSVITHNTHRLMVQFTPR